MVEGRYKPFTACSQFEMELDAYLEGELRPFIVSHSQQCRACSDLLADLQSIRRAASQLPLEQPSQAVWVNVRGKLEVEGRLRKSACVRYGEELEAYLQGEARPFVPSHAQDCGSCGALLADLQFIRQAAHDLPFEEPSPAVWAGLRAQLELEGAFAVAACARFQDELEDYFEGEARPFVVSHSQDCRSCGALLADFEAIIQAGSDLPLEEPQRANWDGLRQALIADGVIEQPGGGWRQILSWRFLPQLVPLGALAGLVILASVLTLPWGNLQPWERASNDLRPRSDDGSLAQVVSELETNFRASEGSMAPDLKATYDKSLVSLDHSIKECLDSLQNEPRNALAREYLLTAYSSKAEVLSSALEFDGR